MMALALSYLACVIGSHVWGPLVPAGVSRSLAGSGPWLTAPGSVCLATILLTAVQVSACSAVVACVVARVAGRVTGVCLATMPLVRALVPGAAGLGGDGACLEIPAAARCRSPRSAAVAEPPPRLVAVTAAPVDASTRPAPT